MNLPVYCARGDRTHLATHRVVTSTRAEVVCDHHLNAAKAWAGPGVQVIPVIQPEGHDPPAGGEQPALF